MTTVIDIQRAVQSLPEAELAAFCSVFDAFEESCLDCQIEADQRTAEPLLVFMERAKDSCRAGLCKGI